MCDCDCEQPQVYNQDKPISRKEHRCCECRGTIHPGETYYRHHGIWDRTALTFKVCVDCELLRIAMHTPDCCIPFERLGECVRESNKAEWIEMFAGIKKRRGVVVSRGGK